MAHFCKLDKDNIVITTVVIANDVPTSNGPLGLPGDSGGNDMHIDGEAYCRKLFKDSAVWKQTSYNNNFRKQYASAGYTYDENADLFISPKPFESWILDNNFDWNPPIARPDVLEHPVNGNPMYPYWDDPNQQWLGSNAEEVDGVITWYDYTWNTDNFEWENKTAKPIFSAEERLT